ncbi:hypothetical protein D3C81_1639160 [compost metagenome]
MHAHHSTKILTITVIESRRLYFCRLLGKNQPLVIAQCVGMHMNLLPPQQARIVVDRAGIQLRATQRATDHAIVVIKGIVDANVIALVQG